MKRLTALCATAALAPAAAFAGEVFGTIKGDKGPVGEGAEVAAKCGDASFGPVKTDKKGSYRLVIGAMGKCTLTVTQDGKSASLDVVSFESASQTDVVLKSDGGKLTATRG